MKYDTWYKKLRRLRWYRLRKSRPLPRTRYVNSGGALQQWAEHAIQKHRESSHVSYQYSHQVFVYFTLSHGNPVSSARSPILYSHGHIHKTHHSRSHRRHHQFEIIYVVYRSFTHRLHDLQVVSIDTKTTYWYLFFPGTINNIIVLVLIVSMKYCCSIISDVLHDTAVPDTSMPGTHYIAVNDHMLLRIAPFGCSYNP